MKHIEINTDWFYHRITTKTFDKMIRSGGIKAKRQYMSWKEIIKTKPDILWNGLWYISLAKLEESVFFDDSSYDHFIRNHFAFVIHDINPIKTKVCRNVFAQLWSSTPSNIRFSLYEDEYQIKNEIPLEKIVGIKLPESSYIPSLFSKNQEEMEHTVQALTTTMHQTNTYFPFLDLKQNKQIEHQEIKAYLKKKQETMKKHV